jgi:DNA topoisomerase-1
MVVKLSRYGKFLACSSYPRCKGKKLLPEEEARRAKQEEERREIEQKLQLPPCPECGAPLTVKRGRYGMFIGCSGYPSCRHIQKLAMPSGISCPTCGSGEIVEKRTRRGKRFWGCNRYPACSYATWVNPVKNAGAEPCEGTIPEKR